MKTTLQEATTKVWLVLTFGEDRQHAGNSGYDDDPGKWYSYDSYVANHRQVADGHFAIVCDRVRALGIARITRIDSAASIRALLRCPACKTTGIKSRQTKEPAYRCKNGHEFENPIRENAGCTKYTAYFGETFTRFTGAFGRDFLRQGCPRYSDQLAMQAFDYLKMEAVFRGTFSLDASLISDLISNPYMMAETADNNGLSEFQGYKPTEKDDRERALRQIRLRRGQQKFRDNLRTRYGDQCMISGCKVLDVLEAAHVRPYLGALDNHPENGLLLRADLHTLFDLDLVGIEP